MWVDVIGALVVLAVLGFVWRFLIGSHAERAHRARALKWRIRLRLHPGRGYASFAELAVRWGKLAAVNHGRRARPDLGLWARLRGPATDYAVRLGRTWYSRRCFARMEDQTLMLAPQRVGKTGILADRIIDHPGAVLCTSSRSDLYDMTAGDRAARGPISVFNPMNVGDVRSTFGWNPLDGCENPAVASQRAEAFIGRLLEGDMAFWQKKAIVGLAALLHAAALSPGATIGDVYGWANRHGDQMAEEILTRAGAAGLPLLATIKELRLATKAADSIRGTISEALTFVTVPSVFAAVNPLPGYGLDPVAFARECGTIYMVAPGGDAGPIAPLFRAFTAHVQYTATLAGSRWRYRKLVPPVLLALDELHANPVPLPSWLADGAGKGMLVAAVVHDYGQLEELYGPAGARTVWGTTGTKLFFGGIHADDTLEKVSRLCGRVRVGHGEHARDVEVAPVDFLRMLPDTRALVLRMNLSPVVVKVRPVWKRWDRRLWRHAPAAPLPLSGPWATSAELTDIEPVDSPAPAAPRPPQRLRRAAGE
jgi:hypothetical protein